MKTNQWPEVAFEDIAASSRYPIGDGDHGAIKPAMYADSGIPYIRVADIGDGELLKEKMVFISPEVHRNNPKSHLFPNDIVISKTGATIGKVALIPPDMKESNTTSSVGKVTVDPKKANPRFVLQFMRSPRFQTTMWSVSHKSAQPGFNIKDLKLFKVPLPPLAEQERIVKLLDEADELRKLRAQTDHHTEALIPALFHEMFGDPNVNSKGWPQSLFSEVGKLDRGRSKNRPRDETSLYGGKYPFIQTGDVANSNGEITAYTQTYSEKGLAQSRLWPAGTLCITIAANIGKTAVLTFPACFPDSMVGFVPGEEVVIDYVRQWLVTMESRLEEAAPQMAQKNINLKILSELAIPVPPLALQKKFAAHVSEIRTVQAEQAASRRRLDDLFQSTLHRAFQGEC